MTVGALALGMLPGPAQAATAVVAFSPATSWPSGGTDPIGVATGDLDGDGRPDLVVPDYAAGTVAVLANLGGGSFGPARSFAAGSGPEGAAVADFTGDGRADVAVADASGTVALLAGDGAGNLVPLGSVSGGGSSTMGLAAGDFNGDGRPDLAVANYGSGTVGVLLGNGDGTFAAARTYPGGYTASHPLAVVVADMTLDGRPDLVVTAAGTTGTVRVLTGNGDGTFTPRTVVGTGGAHPSGLAAGDLTGDGVPDVAVGNVALSGTVAVLAGDGTGAFSSLATYPTGGSLPDGAVVADFDRDGRPDLAVTNAGTDTVAVLTAGPTGLAPALTFGAGGSDPVALAAADLNGDGAPDLAAANAVSGTVGVLAQQVAVFDVSFLSPLDGGMLRPGSSTTVRAALLDLAGARVTDAVAAPLAGTPCRVWFSATGAQSVAPVCMRYDTTNHQFVAGWRLGRATGPETLTVTVTYPGSAVTTSRSVAISIGR
ncbi:MAG TPA: VCBS repeat-containing protein [Acidimicrobiales bacterium]|nr:VCBS repeat-containing protein [Acidimicrobiales bacterium]